MINYFVFDGKNSRDYGVYISGAGTYNAPERNTKTVSVVGRNGNLTIDEGTYKNAPLAYPAFIFTNFNDRIEAFRNFLLSRTGYRRLEDSYHPDEYRLARYSGNFESDVIDELYAGKFTLNFDCQPQRFLKSGEIAVSVSDGDMIVNETLQVAKPLIRCYGNGTLTIGDVAITAAGVTDYIDIDCDLQEAYHDTLATSMNDKITLVNGVFYELVSGENEIDITGFTDVQITPRWWIV